MSRSSATMRNRLLSLSHAHGTARESDARAGGWADVTTTSDLPSPPLPSRAAATSAETAASASRFAPTRPTPRHARRRDARHAAPMSQYPKHEPPPPYGMNPPMQPPPPGGPTIAVVVGGPPLGPTPAHITCPSCHAQIQTRVTHESSTKTHVIALLLCLFGCWPCVCLPYCMDSCQNANHHCPACGSFLGTHRN